jgi:hypothetical protein
MMSEIEYLDSRDPETIKAMQLQGLEFAIKDRYPHVLHFKPPRGWTLSTHPYVDHLIGNDGFSMTSRFKEHICDQIFNTCRGTYMIFHVWHIIIFSDKNDAVLFKLSLSPDTE